VFAARVLTLILVDRRGCSESRPPDKVGNRNNTGEVSTPCKLARRQWFQVFLDGESRFPKPFARLPRVRVWADFNLPGRKHHKKMHFLIHNWIFLYSENP